MELIPVHRALPERQARSPGAAGLAGVRPVITIDDTAHLRPADPTTGPSRKG